jgi:hypothetical protein
LKHLAEEPSAETTSQLFNNALDECLIHN